MLKISTSNLRGDLTGGLTAGIVALPLALALGVLQVLALWPVYTVQLP